MDMTACQDFVTTYGITAFLAECQHVEESTDGTTFAHLDFESMRCERSALPEMLRVVVWCDPA